MIVLPYTEEILTPACIEGYGSFEVSDYSDCCCHEGKGGDDEGMA
jgi:hypothetical protein